MILKFLKPNNDLKNSIKNGIESDFELIIPFTEVDGEIAFGLVYKNDSDLKLPKENVCELVNERKEKTGFVLGTNKIFIMEKELIESNCSYYNENKLNEEFWTDKTTVDILTKSVHMLNGDSLMYRISLNPDYKK
ncbi:hypothetical protein VO56_02215 [Mycoplasmopsis gallinacea]|uniref:Uncharacterized protein n=1 Tax=Mycoplasmopsis gallinacea TaxID=29556 RepID=A0A0D5ZJI6_9BACT|nr:hypothetical protein VO56_02215 [Mycoplasmopsis gallinacea]